MDGRTMWTDPALDREFERVYKQINGTPVRMAQVELALKTLGRQVQDLVEENQELRKEIRGSEWTRTQIIGALGVLVAFLSTAVLAVQAVYG